MEGIGVVHDSTELRKLIAENPDLPIVVLADEEANNGYWGWMYCSSVSYGIDYILDIETPYDDETLFTDKIEFEEAVYDGLCCHRDDAADVSDEEYEAMVKEEIEKYKPYWRNVIAIYATN